VKVSKGQSATQYTGHSAEVCSYQVDPLKLLGEMRQERERVIQVIAVLERLAFSRGQGRRGRPPASVTRQAVKRRGRPPGRKGKPKDN
jgi:hypothetical protein